MTLHTWDICIFKSSGRHVPGLAQRLFSMIFIFKELTEKKLHRLRNVRIVLHKTPLVVLAVQAVGNLDSHNMPPLVSHCKLAAEFGDIPLHPALPFFGGVAAARDRVQILPQIVLVQRTVRLRLERVVCKAAAFLRILSQPPEWRIHMQPEHDGGIGTMFQHPLHLPPCLSDVQLTVFGQHLLKPDIQLVELESGLGKLRNTVRRQSLVGAVASRTVGQGIKLRDCRHTVDIQGRTAFVRFHLGTLHRLGKETARRCKQKQK